MLRCRGLNGYNHCDRSRWRVRSTPRCWSWILLLQAQRCSTRNDSHFDESRRCYDWCRRHYRAVKGVSIDVRAHSLSTFLPVFSRSSPSGYSRSSPSGGRDRLRAILPSYDYMLFRLGLLKTCPQTVFAHMQPLFLSDCAQLVSALSASLHQCFHLPSRGSGWRRACDR